MTRINAATVLAVRAFASPVPTRITLESEDATATAADRKNRLLVENWVDRHAVVLCFENAAMRRPNVR